MSKKRYSVYKHTSPQGKVYIGITNQNPPSNRWKGGDGYYHNQYFENAIKKNGWDNFKHEILHTGMTANEAMEKEIELIKFYKSNNKKYGYNLSTGGGGRVGVKHTEETKKKMSEAATGRKKSKEHRINLSKANIERFKDPEQRKKLGDIRRGKKLTPEQRKKLSEIRIGYKFSEEAKRKMSLAALESWDIERKLNARKPVNQYDLQGNYIQSFTGVREAGETLGISSGHISSCCKGKRKTIGGYIWRYANEQN